MAEEQKSSEFAVFNFDFDHTHLFALVFGCSGSGKSFLTRDIMHHIEESKYWKHVIVMSPTERATHTIGIAHDRNIYDELDLPLIDKHIELRKKVLKKKGKLKPLLFIIDDCAADPRLRARTSPLNTLFISGRHLKMGCVVLLQNMNALDSVGPPLRNNATLLAITRPKKCKDRQFIVREWFSMGSEKEGEETLLKLTHEPYEFVIVDLKKYAGAKNLTDFIYKYKAVEQKPFKMGHTKIPETLSQYMGKKKRKKEKEKFVEAETDTEIESTDTESDTELKKKVHRNALKDGIRGRIETLTWGAGDIETFFTPFETDLKSRKRKRYRVLKL